MAVRVVFLAHRVAMGGMGVPFHSPAALNMAVVLAEKEVQRARESRDERDVGKRPADEVVTAVRRPVNPVVQTGKRHASTLTSPSPIPHPARISGPSEGASTTAP